MVIEFAVILSSLISTCSLRFEIDFQTIEGVRFDIEENTIIEAFVRFLASVAIPK